MTSILKHMNNFRSLCAANSRIGLLELLIVSVFLPEGFWSFTVNYELANNVYCRPCNITTNGVFETQYI